MGVPMDDKRLLDFETIIDMSSCTSISKRGPLPLAALSTMGVG
jgi:hypothetical protein